MCVILHGYLTIAMYITTVDKWKVPTLKVGLDIFGMVFSLWTMMLVAYNVMYMPFPNAAANFDTSVISYWFDIELFFCFAQIGA